MGSDEISDVRRRSNAPLQLPANIGEMFATEEYFTVDNIGRYAIDTGRVQLRLQGIVLSSALPLKKFNKPM